MPNLPTTLIMSTKDTQPVENDAQSESTNTTLNTPDDTAAMEPEETQAIPPSSGTRRLRRLTRTSGNSRLAKLSEDRRQQKSAGSIRKPEDLIGASLADGRYRIVGRLGKGSMAYVLRATDSRLETDVVVKIPKPEKLAGDEIRERFRRESQLLVRLAHPHVVKVLDVGEYEEVPYVVMQLLSGGTLTDRMEQAGKSRQMAADSIKRWIREVSRALDFCAKQGTVHRDVKPANILFDDDDNAYVADFGLTKIMYGEHTSLNSSETTTGVVLGTPNYIAPEIVLGDAYDGRADQYSLGITLYHTLFGRAPMQGNSATLTMINQTQKQLQLLSDVRSDIPKELALAIRKSIEKDPTKRFSSCEEFAEAALDGLRGSSASSIMTTAPVAPPATRPRPKKRRPPTESASGQSARSSKKKRPTAVSEAIAFDDYMSDSDNWLTAGAAPLPPKRSNKAGTGTKKKKKASQPTEIVVFGKEVQPVVLVGGGIASALMLLLSIFLFSGGDPEGEGAIGANATVINAEPSPGGSGSGGDDNKNSASGKPKKLQGEGTNEGQRTEGSQQSAAASSAPVRPPTNVTQKNVAHPISVTKTVSEAAKKNTGKAIAAETTTDFMAISEFAQPLYQSIPYRTGDSITAGPTSSSVLVTGTTVWDKVNGAIRAKLNGSYAGNVQTTLSADGSLFAAAAKSVDQQNNSVTVWDTKTGQELFTAPGDSKRYADVILLSSDSLFVGDRWSNELLTWKCSDGRKSKSIKIEEAKFKQGNAAISNDGQYIAAVANGRMIVVSAKDGKGVAVMQNPGETPVARRAALSGKGSKTDTKRRESQIAEPIYAAMESLRFSIDNQELAGYSNHPRGRMICWNNVGSVIADHATFVRYSHPRDHAALQWLESRDAWLVSDRLTLRSTGQVVLMLQRGGSDVPALHVYDDDHVVGVLPSSPSKLSIVPIPWNDIQAALKRFRENDATAHLSRETTTSLKINLQPHVKMSPQQMADVRKAFHSTVTRDGLKVDQERKTIFSIAVASPDEATPILNRMIPSEHRTPLNTHDVRGAEFVVAELLLPGKAQPIWRVNLGSLEDIGLTGTVVASVEELQKRIESLVVPYFIPANEDDLALPVVIH